ncbi:DnaB Replicative DNA helicase [uncultured Caudovirales phage]|uniref:DNA helicase/primase n=1 Tax=uncultured Caudovirales phage TaxID=2100421 RepID=A0A6J5P180_9CAUD|nr:DnaB Replicative DNA helicase [uncultured Caudovirales phage]
MQFASGDYEALDKRAISEKTCRHFGYQVGNYQGKAAHIAPFYDEKGKLCGQKVRLPGKDFRVIGKVTDRLFGQNLWNSGKRVVITEGEVDALSYAEITDCKWPVVSVPNGASGAKKSLEASIEWLEGFDEIVLAFDNDQAGQEAAAECYPLFTPGKAKVATLSRHKDFNEALQADDRDAIMQAVWNAKVIRPDGIIEYEDIWEKLTEDRKVDTSSYPWDGLTKITRGIRKGELVVITAGTGIGKSALCREIAYDLTIKQGRRVGLMFLEENARRTALGMLGLHANTPLHLQDSFDAKTFEKEFDAVFGTKRFYIFDSFGSIEIDHLLNRIRFMAISCKCDYIFLDHLSIVLSGLDIQDERKAVDVAMTRLRTLVEQTGVGLIVVSHLRRMHSDESHETGAVPQLSQLRGSHGIAQLADMVLAARRNQQADPDKRNQTELYVLKNRFSGETGYACSLVFNPETYRITERHNASQGDVFNDEDDSL